MKITEALKGCASDGGRCSAVQCDLGLWFRPLHLRTFLNAHLQLALPGRAVRIKEGLYGDLCGTLERLGEGDGVVVVIEWPDLDARFDYRNAGAWRRESMASIVENATLALDRMKAALGRIPAGTPVALALPVFPIAPIFSAPVACFRKPSWCSTAHCFALQPS